MYDPVPHFSTFGKNYTRRFKDTDLFEQIFAKILEECYKCNFVDSSMAFVDATHVKARANNKKIVRTEAKQAALFYEGDLKKEIDLDRENHGKKPLKNKDDNDNTHSSSSGLASKDTTVKTVKTSTTDTESGWFRKGEHKEVFAYSVETACDKNG